MALGELLSTEGLGLASQPLRMAYDGRGWSYGDTQPDLLGTGVGVDGNGCRAIVGIP